MEGGKVIRGDKREPQLEYLPPPQVGGEPCMFACFFANSKTEIVMGGLDFQKIRGIGRLLTTEEFVKFSKVRVRVSAPAARR